MVTHLLVGRSELLPCSLRVLGDAQCSGHLQMLQMVQDVHSGYVQEAIKTCSDCKHKINRVQVKKHYHLQLSTLDAYKEIQRALALPLLVNLMHIYFTRLRFV